MSTRLWWIVLGVLFVLSAALQRGPLAVFVLILALATATSELWARYCLSNVSYRRRLGVSQIAFGEETSLALEFVNAKPLPLAWLLVRDRFPPEVLLLTEKVRTGITQQSTWLVNVVSLRWYERVTRTHRIVGARRGVFEFGPAELSSGDVLGFRRRQRQDDLAETLVVYPKIVPIAELGLPAGRPMGEWLAHRRIIEDPLRLAMVRDYAPGDNPRYIHWKASAHTGHLQTKVFDPSDTLSLTIAVDVQTYPRAYEYVPEYLETILSAAGSLAVHALNERYMVGLCANGFGREGQHWEQIRPGRHPQQANLLLGMLAAVQPFRGMSFETMLYELLPNLPFGATVVAISARPQEELYEALATLEGAGHPSLLLTVGEDVPNVPVSLRTHHLGGRDVWQRLETLELA